MMESTQPQLDSDRLSLGSFDGPKEGYAKLFTWMTLVGSAVLIVGPWVLKSISTSHAEYPHTRIHVSPTFLLVEIDALGAIFAFVYYTIYKRLSARIVEGGPESNFLDGIRLSVATLGFGALIVVILTCVRFFLELLVAR